MTHSNERREGDIGFTHPSDKQYHPFKILKIERWPDDSIVWHVLGYEPVDREPTEADIKNFKIIARHAPIASFEKEAKFIANIPVSTEELQGYFEYLKRTDFRKFIEESGADLEEIINEAQNYYKKGYNLDTEKRYQEALAAYYKAIDLFPLFYEAIDNAAFCRMDMGDYEGAIDDFQNSLKINLNNFTAQCSLAECYFRIKKYEQAKVEVEKSLQLQDDPFAHGLLLKIQEALR